MLAFSIHSIPDGPYNDKVDEYGMIYDLSSKSQKKYRDIESMKRVYDNNLPLFVVMGSAGNKSKLGWIKSINTLSKEWIISFSDE